MKQIAATLFFSLCLACSNAQTTNSIHSKAINEQAGMMAQYLLKKDFESFSKYTYPKIIEMMGGRQQMVAVLEKGSKEMLSQGIDILGVSFGEPSAVIAVGNELQCTVPETIEMKVPDGRMITTATLIAISMDKGSNWYFIDTSGKDIRAMKQILPNLGGALVIPEKKQPVFYQD